MTQLLDCAAPVPLVLAATVRAVPPPRSPRTDFPGIALFHPAAFEPSEGPARCEDGTCLLHPGKAGIRTSGG